MTNVLWFEVRPYDVNRYVILPYLDDITIIILRHVLLGRKIPYYMKKRTWKQVFRYYSIFYEFIRCTIHNNPSKNINYCIIAQNIDLLKYFIANGCSLSSADLHILSRERKYTNSRLRNTS